MRALLTIIGKDLRLLWRDKAGLLFLSIAPIVVITVAGFSLARFYGADSTGQTAYELPLVDEDGGPLAQEIRDRLVTDPGVRLRMVSSREEAQQLVRSKRVGSALVIPQGTQARLEDGQPASMLIYTDAAKYLERLNVRSRLLGLENELVAAQRRQMSQEAETEREHLRLELGRLRSVVAATRDQVEAAWKEASQARADAEVKTRHILAQAQRLAEEQLRRELTAALDSTRRQVEKQVALLQEPLRRYLDALAVARHAFAVWLAELKRLAGRHAADMPPPPSFPEPPEALTQLLSGPLPLPHIDDLTVPVFTVPVPELPSFPAPAIVFPEVRVPDVPQLPGALSIEEINLSGGPTTINTFDQNVPGFSITFLLLGMLLGVSLGLLDERDWGTLDRLRTMPIAAHAVLLGKLVSRFLVGLLQMVVLFAVGRLAFGISLGPQPWALLLPTAGIVFAGTAVGLIVAGATWSREAVLPLGSMVIVTMAAVGGCWWPIDVEPRWMRTIALALPTTWAMDAFNDLMIRRRTAAAAFVPTGMMVIYGVVYLIVGLFLFRRQLRRLHGSK